MIFAGSGCAGLPFKVRDYRIFPVHTLYESHSKLSMSAAPGGVDVEDSSTRPPPLAQEPPSPLVPRNVSAPSQPSIPAPKHNQTLSTSSGGTPSDVPDAHAPSPPLITLTHVFPNHGPLCGQEDILAIGTGFHADQELLIRFGQNNTITKTTFMAPNNLKCILPPYHTAGPVIVTLQSRDKPGLVSQDSKVLFTYEDIYYKL